MPKKSAESDLLEKNADILDTMDVAQDNLGKSELKKLNKELKKIVNKFDLKKKPGRKKKAKSEDDSDTKVKRRPGRPPKSEKKDDSDVDDVENMKVSEMNDLAESYGITLSGSKNEKVKQLKAFQKKLKKLSGNSIKKLKKIAKEEGVELKIDGRLKDEEKIKERMAAQILSYEGSDDDDDDDDDDEDEAPRRRKKRRGRKSKK